MLEVGTKDPQLIVLVGDIDHFRLQPFARACPGRYYNIGICEPTIMSMAAGLSKLGFFPVVHTITPFLVERSFEQIKDDFGYQRLGVNIATIGSAFDFSGLGCTHHCYDDFALLKNVEGMQIFYPATPIEFNELFKQTYRNGLPTYYRLPVGSHGINFPRRDIKVGKGIKVKQGKNLTIVVAGSQLKTALEAVPALKKMHIDPEILYIHTIKPFDSKLIQASLAKTKRCLVIEEHGKYGGVFEEVLRSGQHIYGVRYAAMQISEEFIHHYGTYEDLCKQQGFSVPGVIKKVKRELL